jgi:hypothetical protein
MASPPPDLTTLLARLGASGVEFVLVGALAAVAQGAPLTTHDVDVVHRRTPENVEKLLAVLAALNARYRTHPAEPPLRPTREHLLGEGHQLLATDLGPLDVLGAIEGGRGFEDLAPASVTISVAGAPLKVLRLAALADLKRGSAAPKDRLTLAILEETLERIARQG